MKCPNCNGKGKIISRFKPSYTSKLNFSTYDSEREVFCIRCKGTGEVTKFSEIKIKLKEIIEIIKKR